MGWTVIEHKSAPAGGVFDFTGKDLSAYSRVAVVLDDVVVSVDGAFVDVQAYYSGVLQTTLYRYWGRAHNTAGTSVAYNSNSASAVRVVGGTSMGVGNAAGESFGGRLEISSLSASLMKAFMFSGAGINPAGNGLNWTSGGSTETAGTLDGVKILPSSGTFSSGRATLYGFPAA